MRDFGALHRFLAERAAMPFEWGSAANDCVSFVAAAVRTQTGFELLDGLHWTNEAEADAAVESVDGLATAFSRKLPEIAPALAKRGDVGAIVQGNELILVVVEGDTLAGPGPRRMRRLPRKLLARAWSIDPPGSPA